MKIKKNSNHNNDCGSCKMEKLGFKSHLDLKLSGPTLAAA